MGGGGGVRKSIRTYFIHFLLFVKKKSLKALYFVYLIKCRLFDFNLSDLLALMIIKDIYFFTLRAGETDRGQNMLEV